MTPTARTLAELKRRNLTAQVVEHTVPRVRIKRDLFGVIDILVMNPSNSNAGILGIQATSGTNHAARRAKILAEPRALEWLRCGGRLQVWSWSKKGPRGKRKLWTVRVEEILATDFYREEET